MAIRPHLGLVCCALWTAIAVPAWNHAGLADLAPRTAVQESFDTGAGNFAYADDAFRGTNAATYASGTWSAIGGYGGGALRLDLGGVDASTVQGHSGAWSTSFIAPGSSVMTLSFRFHLTQSATYESDERAEMLVGVDGALQGLSGNDYVAVVVGDGNGGDPTGTGWQLAVLDLGPLAAGSHTLTLGAYGNKKTTLDESTTLFVDDVRLFVGAEEEPDPGPQAAVDSLDFSRFKQNILTFSNFGDRSQFGSGSQSYTDAASWVESELASFGYTIEHHAFTYQGNPRTSIYVTRSGSVYPDRMYIVSAHLDGRGGGGAADDDGSGSALVLEAARVLSLPEFECDYSLRFVFWNNEETGLDGSEAYVADRATLQGIETPPGSGQYPEPVWLGIVQHDMILFDHGLPPQANQIAAADVDVEYQLASTQASAALALADALHTGNGSYSQAYPAEVGSNMRFTDSWPFRDHTAAVSVRENQRVAEIGSGANPHWHQPTDVYATYSEADFMLGFNALQMTLGTVAELAGLRLATPTSRVDEPVRRQLRLLPSAPEPFRETTIIRLSLPRDGFVEMTIYDVQGRLVRSVRVQRRAGERALRWDGRTNAGQRAASGTYYARVVTRDGAATQKLTLLR